MGIDGWDGGIDTIRDNVSSRVGPGPGRGHAGVGADGLFGEAGRLHVGV